MNKSVCKNLPIQLNVLSGDEEIVNTHSQLTFFQFWIFKDYQIICLKCKVKGQVGWQSYPQYSVFLPSSISLWDIQSFWNFLFVQYPYQFFCCTCGENIRKFLSFGLVLFGDRWTML